MSVTDHFAEPGSGRESDEDVEAEVDLVAAERVVFFSDAVAAIAITLLALDLYIPKGNTATAALQDARAHFLVYLAFVISFAVIARHWRTHHRMFAGVTRLTARLVTVNFFWLGFIVITPFATRLLTVGEFRIGFAFYSFVQIATLLTVLVIKRQIRGNMLFRGHMQDQLDDNVDLLTNMAMFAVSIPFAFLVKYWAFAFWAAASYVARYVRSRRHPSA
jgi:uncharacterized membrane protein